MNKYFVLRCISFAFAFCITHACPPGCQLNESEDFCICDPTLTQSINCSQATNDQQVLDCIFDCTAPGVCDNLELECVGSGVSGIESCEVECMGPGSTCEGTRFSCSDIRRCRFSCLSFDPMDFGRCNASDFYCGAEDCRFNCIQKGSCSDSLYFCESSTEECTLVCNETSSAPCDNMVWLCDEVCDSITSGCNPKCFCYSIVNIGAYLEDVCPVPNSTSVTTTQNPLDTSTSESDENEERKDSAKTVSLAWLILGVH